MSYVLSTFCPSEMKINQADKTCYFFIAVCNAPLAILFEMLNVHTLHKRCLKCISLTRMKRWAFQNMA